MGFLHVLDMIAEKEIQKSQEKGDFDHLEGFGKPLVLEDDSMIPEDLRMSYKILKNSGYLPPEVEDKKEIQRTADLLENEQDEHEKIKQMEKLHFLITKLNMKRHRPICLEQDGAYYEKITSRISVNKKKSS